MNSSILRVRGREGGLRKSTEQRREDLLFGEFVVDGDVAEGAGAGETDAGGEKCGSGELQGRVYKVRSFGEG